MSSSRFILITGKALLIFAFMPAVSFLTAQAQTSTRTSNPSDPTRPPAVVRPDAQTPPGTTPVTTVTPAPVVAPRTTAPSVNTTVPDSTLTRENNQTTTTTTAPMSGIPPNSPATFLPPMSTLSRAGVVADNTLPLSLDESIRRALENNNEIELARDDVNFAETQLLALEGFYEPTLRIMPQVSSVVSPVADVLSGSDRSGTVTRTNITGDYALIKPFRTGGGTYEFFFNNTREATSSTVSQFTPFYSSSLGVRFTQPLLRNRSIDLGRRAIRVQRRVLSQFDADFRRRVIDVVADVQRAYWDLVLALRDQQNRVSSLNLVRELFRQTEIRISNGAVAPIERVEVETELANRESEVLVASQNVSLAENRLKRLILRDQLASEWSAALVPTDEPSFNEVPVSLTDALADARANRPELSRLNLQKEINDIDLLYYKDQTRKRIDLEATVATTGLAGNPVNTSGSTPDTPNVVPGNLIGGYGRTLRNLVSLNTRNVVVGVRIELPWRNKRAKAELAGAQIRRTQIQTSMRVQEQTIAGEVRDATQAVETARLRVLTARGARRSAELQLAGEQRLYSVGRSTTFLLFQRENQLTNARSLQLRAETDYNKALADLQRSTSTTLHVNNIILETSSAER